MHNQDRSIRIIRIGKLASHLGISRTTLWRMEKEGKLPSRVKVSEGVTGWLEEDIRAWLDSRREGSDQTS